MKVREVRTLSSAAAAELVQRAVQRATEMGVSVCVAVTGRDGHLLAFQRMDGAPFLSAQISQDKAATAAAFNLGTEELFAAFAGAPAVREGLPHVARFTFLGGGLPIRWQGETVGGIGVSGGSEEQDTDCARAALRALEE